MSPLERYCEPARARSGVWRVLIGLIVIGLCWVAGMILVLSGWMVVQLSSGLTVPDALAALSELQGSGQPQSIAIMLASFAGIWVGVALTVWLVHGQPFFTVLAPVRQGALRDFGRGVLFGLAFALPSLAMGLLVADPLPGLPLERWIFWILPIAVLVCIQAIGEELIFRGYLLQQLAIRARHWAVWAVLPSLIFGLMHATGARPDMGDFYYVAITTVMGATMAALVWRTGSLMAAAGTHVTVNLLSLSLIGPGGDLGGTQLWNFPDSAVTALYQVDLLIVCLMLGFVLSPMGDVFGRPEK